MRSTSRPAVLSTRQRQALSKELRILSTALNLLGVLWIREICTKYLKLAHSVGTKPEFKLLDVNTTTRCHYGETSLPTAIQCQPTQNGLSHSTRTKLFYRARKSTLVTANLLRRQESINETLTTYNNNDKSCARSLFAHYSLKGLTSSTDFITTA